MNNNQEVSDKQKQYLENTLSTFIFGILGIIIPIFIFSVMSLHYSGKHAYKKLSKLHMVGTKLAYIGIVMSGLAIIIISVINIFS